MSVLRSYLLGLIVAHVVWLFFFTTGQLLWKSRPDNSKPVRLDTLVITSVAGMALSGFGLLLLGFAHLLNRFGLAGLLILEAAFFRLLRRDNWLSLIFWRRIVQDFVKGWTFPAFCIYVLFLALGLPAILPPIARRPSKLPFRRTRRTGRTPGASMSIRFFVFRTTQTIFCCSTVRFLF